MTVIERERTEVLTREKRAAILEAAALEIDVRGWTQTHMEDAQGRVCARGALLKTTYEWAETVWGWEDGAFMLARFNDTTGRTAAEVTFLLRWRAAEIRDGL